MEHNIVQNKVKSIGMIAGFVIFITLLGLVLAKVYDSPGLLVTALIFGLGYAAISYFLGTRMSVAVNGAKQIQREDNPRLWEIVSRLAVQQGLPMPKVFIMPDPALNAFATGRNYHTAIVCVTSGLLEAMDDKELSGVIGHELGHVKNYDIRVSMLAFALTAVISVIADFILHATLFRSDDDEDSGSPLLLIFGIAAAVIVPIVATLIQLAISRQREYLADATGAHTANDPDGLASALQKIAQSTSITAKQNTSTAHLFFANPLRRTTLTSLFSTHPPITSRIQRLKGSR